MKKTFLILSLISTSIFSQTITYDFSEEFETVKGHKDLGFYKLNENEYSEVYYRKGEDMIFQIYDEKFKKIKKQEIVPIPEESKKVGHHGLFSVKNDYFWFYETWDRETETERLFSRGFDKNTLKFSGKEIKLIETGRLDPYLKYRFYTSTDSSKMLVTYRVIPKERNDKLNNDKIGFNLFDYKMNKIYAAEIEMPYTEADMTILDYQVDSRGNIYMLSEVKLNNSLEGEKVKNLKNAYRYELIRVNQQNNSLQAIKLGLDNKYSKSVVLSEDLNNNIVITGFYSNKKNSGSADGAYTIKLELDEKNSIKELKTTYSEFPIEVLKSYESENKKYKMDKKEKADDLEADDLVFDKVIFYKDGSMMFIGEEYYVIEHTNVNSNGNYTTTYTYYFNDILVLKTDKNGKTLWCKKIPKYQKGKATKDLSYHHHSFNDNECFFYLDNAKNIDLPLTETPEMHMSGKGGYLTCVKIDSNGNMTKKSIFNIKDEEVKIYPKEFESISNNLIVDRLKADRKESKVFRIEIK